MSRSTGARAAPAGSAPVFATLGDPIRLRLVSRLVHDGPMSLSKLTRGSGITRQGVSKHLRVLESAGLVRSTQRGRESIWALERKRLAEAQRHLRTISAQWDETLARLKSYVERQA